MPFLPYTIKTMHRAGKYRRCVLRIETWPSGTPLMGNVSHMIYMEI